MKSSILLHEVPASQNCHCAPRQRWLLPPSQNAWDPSAQEVPEKHRGDSPRPGLLLLPRHGQEGRRKGLVTAGSTPEKECPSTGLQTPQLIYTTDFTTMLTERREGEGNGAGLDRKRGIQSQGRGGERGR